jgi:hypothetical protein
MANFDLSKLMEGKNPQQVMLAETRELKSKWEQTGLLEGLNQREQGQISVLLENQAKQLLDEATQTGGQGSEEWSGVALPLVRRIFGEIASKEFVSVQPMNLPSGLIFYLDFKYGSAAQGRSTSESLFGGSGADLGSTDVAENGLYGDGRFGYSINESEATNVAIDGFASASLPDVGWDSALSASIAAGEVKLLQVSASRLSDSDVDAVRSFNVTDTAFTAQYPAHYSYNATTAVYTFIVGGADAIAAPASIDSIKFSEVTSAGARGDFEDRDPLRGTGTAGINDGTDLQIPEVDLELKSEAIVAKTRKLKAVWTPELAQDLNAYHSIDAEAELTSMLSEYISLEIDLESLDM